MDATLPVRMIHRGESVYILWSNGLVTPFENGPMLIDRAKSMLKEAKQSAKEVDIIAYCWWRNWTGHMPRWSSVGEKATMCMPLEAL